MGPVIATGGIHHPGGAVRQGGSGDQRREDSRNGLPPVTGGRNAVVDGVWAPGGGSRSLPPGEAVCPGIVHEVLVGDGARVAGSPSTYST